MGAFSHPKQISQELEIYDYTVLRSSWCTIFSQLCLKLARPVRPVSSQPALAASLLGTVIHSPSLYCIVRALVCHILDRVCLREKMTSFILPISLFYHLFTFTNQTMKMGENIQENQI